MPNIITVTVMRKGSKRFSNKNITPFLGIPLFMHTVNFALQLGFPYFLITDYENLNLPKDVHQYSPISKECNTGEELKELCADIFVLLQVTSPIRDLEYIRDVIKVFSNGNWECATSVTILRNKYCYVYNNNPINFDRSKRDYDGCLRENVMYETGGTYLFKKCQVEKKHILDSEPNKIMLFQSLYDMDIDFHRDLTRLEERMRAT